MEINMICVTDRKLCVGDFWERLEAVVKEKPCAVILREKDLTGPEYREFAVRALAVCRENGVCCILHSFVGVALELKAEAIHLPMPLLRRLKTEEREKFRHLGASCHSVSEAVEAERLGCTYLTAGHVFETDCKKGVPPRGLDFLAEVCAAVSLPVYAIGGIRAENAPLALQAGAEGVCVMSGWLGCGNVAEYMGRLRRAESAARFGNGVFGC